MRPLLCILISVAFIACQSRAVKYSGLNDKFMGAEQVVLYDNGEFYLELTLGGAEGWYSIANDTVYLDYVSKPNHYPDQLLVTDNYIVTIACDQHTEIVRITRSN